MWFLSLAFCLYPSLFFLSLSDSLFPFSLLARGRGCQSSCGPHLGRSASTAKELWVSVSLHGNAWQPIIIITTHTHTQAPNALLPLLPLAVLSGNLFNEQQHEARTPYFTHGYLYKIMHTQSLWFTGSHSAATNYLTTLNPQLVDATPCIQKKIMFFGPVLKIREVIWRDWYEGKISNILHNESYHSMSLIY